jgi:heptosyltransferase III
MQFSPGGAGPRPAAASQAACAWSPDRFAHCSIFRSLFHISMSCAAVFQIGSLGDSIVSVPVVRSLRDLLPECSEYVLVSRFETRMNVMPNHIFDMAWKPRHVVYYRGAGNKIAKAASVASALARLRFYRPRYCVYLLPSERSQTQVDRDAQFFRLAGVKELVGFRTLPQQDRKWSSNPKVQNTEAYLRFRRVWGEHAGEKFPKYAATPIIRPDDKTAARVQEWLQRVRMFPDRQLVALCPYSNYPSRTLSDETIVDLLKRLHDIAGVETVLLGGGKDSAAAERAIAASKTGLNACGLFSPSESAALLKYCVLAICSESGPMHLAGAVGTPTVVTFSRINKDLDQWLPLGKGHTVLYQDNLDCAGCGLTHCKVEGHPCMSRFSSATIFSAAFARLRQLPVLPEMHPGAQVVRW